jgi:hypothetical protein
VTLSEVVYADQSRVLGPVPPSTVPVTFDPSAKTKFVTPPPPVRLTGWVPAMAKVSWIVPPVSWVNPVNARLLVLV